MSKSDSYRGLAVGDAVEWDTFEGVRAGTVTAVGSSWVEVDGHVMPAHVVIVPA